MVVTVFLLFCTVLSFTWGPRCILCVWIVIYQEFCEILWRVFVLVSLYLVSCVFFYGLFTFDVSLSLNLILSLSFHFFNSNWLPLLHAELPGFYRKTGKMQLILTKIKTKTKQNATYYGKKRQSYSSYFSLVCENFQGNGRLNTRAEWR